VSRYLCPGTVGCLLVTTRRSPYFPGGHMAGITGTTPVLPGGVKLLCQSNFTPPGITLVSGRALFFDDAEPKEIAPPSLLLRQFHLGGSIFYPLGSSHWVLPTQGSARPCRSFLHALRHGDTWACVDLQRSACGAGVQAENEFIQRTLHPRLGLRRRTFKHRRASKSCQASPPCLLLHCLAWSERKQQFPTPR
jgi:hypothetical protein